MNEIVKKMGAINKLDLSDKEREDLLFIVGGQEAIAADQITRRRRNQDEVRDEYKDCVNWDKVIELVNEHA